VRNNIFCVTVLRGQKEIIMFKSFIGKCAFFCTVGLVSVLSANEDKIFQEAAENVFRYASSSIDRVEEGKIFFKLDKVCVHQGKIYVEDMNGSPLPIPALFSSEKGPYMQSGRKNIFNLWTCSNCKKLNHDDYQGCQWCGEPR
jgi:hypothetical protein